MPQNSIIVSICACWIIILLYTLDTSETAYTYLLAVSGFTGAMAGFLFAGVNIISAKKMMAENRVSELKYKTPFFPLCNFIWNLGTSILSYCNCLY